MTIQTTEPVHESTQRNAHMSQRILVVEDEVALASGIRDALSHAGFEVEMAHDGAAALEAFRRRLRVQEIDVRYGRRRSGASKHTGSAWPVVRTALRMLRAILAKRLEPPV